MEAGIGGARRGGFVEFCAADTGDRSVGGIERMEDGGGWGDVPLSFWEVEHCCEVVGVGGRKWLAVRLNHATWQARAITRLGTTANTKEYNKIRMVSSHVD